MVNDMYNRNMIGESSQQLNQTLLNNRRMTENSLRMRAMAYQAQIKANLLTETIFEVEESRKVVKKELVDKEEMLLVQSKSAAMGEMISMIAHQWRQPISVISMDVNNILADIELEDISNESLKRLSLDILKQVQELSKTIDDFRNFFKPNKTKEKLLASKIIHDTLNIIESSLIAHNIEVQLIIKDDITMQTYARELMQVFINIINNAKDALIQNQPKQRHITITQSVVENTVEFRFCDNGGGIEDSILTQIFDPYFSTKESKNGTGLGLYMSKIIVQKHLDGKIDACNEADGSCFQIVLPKV